MTAVKVMFKSSVSQLTNIQTVITKAVMLVGELVEFGNEPTTTMVKLPLFLVVSNSGFYT